MARKILTYQLSEPLNGATTAKVDISTGSGNLTIDRLTGGEPLLATGTLQYVESQDLPSRTLNASNGHATLTVRGGAVAQPWFRLPWAACNGAFDWLIHVNPEVATHILAHSGGGNVRLDLTGLVVNRVEADSGGGNMDVVLPEHAADLSVVAKTGAGNVTVAIGSGTTGNNRVDARSGAGNVVVSVPGGLAARIEATSGLGQVTVDPRFSPTGSHTYQSPDYDQAASKVTITIHSGAGNAILTTEDVRVAA